MVKHTQTIRGLLADELFLSVFVNYVGLALKGLNKKMCSWISRSKLWNIRIKYKNKVHAKK